MIIEYIDKNQVAIRNDGNITAYANSPSGRLQVQEDLKEHQELLEIVLEVWGEEPTLPDPEEPIYTEPIESPVLSNEEATEAIIFLASQQEQIIAKQSEMEEVLRNV